MQNDMQLTLNQIQIILFHAMSAVRAIFMAKIHLQKYKQPIIFFFKLTYDKKIQNLFRHNLIKYVLQRSNFNPKPNPNPNPRVST